MNIKIIRPVPGKAEHILWAVGRFNEKADHSIESVYALGDRISYIMAHTAQELSAPSVKEAT